MTALLLAALAAEPARDPWLWPFAADSIWNAPVGEAARLVPAGIQPAARVDVDDELLYRVPEGSPRRPLFAPAGWETRAGGTRPLGDLLIPDDLVVPDARKGSTPNNCAAFLQPDGRTVVSVAPLCRPVAGGPVFGWRFDATDLWGDGVAGSHGGSRLSALGGSIRRGELTGAAPIRHALKVNIFCQRFCFFGPDRKGFRWPATTADGYASARTYRGNNPAVVIGSLLAVPPGVTAETLGLTTPVGKKLHAALRDYGAYVADDSFWDCHYLCAEQGVRDEVAATGLKLSGSKGPLATDVNRLFAALHVVDDNAPGLIGGAGARRQPPPPPLPPAPPPPPAKAPNAWTPAEGYWPDYPRAWRQRHDGFVTRAKQGGADVVFLGDSITEAWGGDGKAVWEKELAPKRAVNFGIGGDGTPQLLWRVQHGTLAGLTPKVVVLMIGTNNRWRGDATPETLEKGVAACVTAIREAAPAATVLLLGIFPTGEKADHPDRKLFTEANARLAKLAGDRVTFLDLTGTFLEADGSISRAVMPDFLHLSATGYERWAGAMRPTLEKLLPAGR